MQLFREEMRTIGWTLWIFVGCAGFYLWLLSDPYAGLLMTVGFALVMGSVITAASALARLLVRSDAKESARPARRRGDDR